MQMKKAYSEDVLNKGITTPKVRLKRTNNLVVLLLKYPHLAFSEFSRFLLVVVAIFLKPLCSSVWLDLYPKTEIGLRPLNERYERVGG